MTDAEIRAELAKHVELGNRGVYLDGHHNRPPLLLLYRGRLKPEAIAELRKQWEAIHTSASGPEVIVLEERMEAYQLVGGEWKKLG